MALLRTRHYKTTTTYRGNGVTHKTVKSRSWIFGPYKTPAQKAANRAPLLALAMLLVFLVLYIPIVVVWLVVALFDIVAELGGTVYRSITHRFVLTPPEKVTGAALRGVRRAAAALSGSL